MPVKAEERAGKWRVVNSDTNDIETNAAGTAVDGGGHDTQDEAAAQARAINARKGVRAELVNALSLGLPGFLTNEDPAVAEGVGVTIKTGEPVGPFGSITEVPVGVLELLPSSELARLSDARALFWVPLEAIPSGQAVDGAKAAKHTWVVRKSGDGYGVFKGSKKGGQHKDRKGAQDCADARNRAAKAGLDELPEELMHGVLEFLRAQGLVTGEADDHTHAYQAGDTETGPRMPELEGDEHTHLLPGGATTTGEANGHAHTRDTAERAGDHEDKDEDLFT